MSTKRFPMQCIRSSKTFYINTLACAQLSYGDLSVGKSMLIERQDTGLIIRLYKSVCEFMLIIEDEV
jgi:hypothetical protein